MVKAIKLRVDKTTGDYSLANYNYYDVETSRHALRMYPAGAYNTLTRIVAKDIKSLCFKYGKFVNTNVGTYEYKEIEEDIVDLIEGNDIEITIEDYLPRQISQTTYYLRRYIKDYLSLNHKQNVQNKGFTVVASLENLMDAYDKLPSDFSMLRKELGDILKELKLFIELDVTMLFELSGSIDYTKQYIVDYLIDIKSKYAKTYFGAHFIRDDSLVPISSIDSYGRFQNRLDSVLEESEDITYLYRELFNSKYTQPTCTSSFNSLYIYFEGKIRVPVLAEESYYLNKDYESYARLPKTFLLDNKVITKATTGYTKVNLFIDLDLDFLSIGEVVWRPEVTTEGFLINSDNLFALDLDYIVSNYSKEFEGIRSLNYVLTLMSKDVMISLINRYVPSISQDSKFQRLLVSMSELDINPEMFRYLIIGLLKDYSRDLGAINLIQFMGANLFGQAVIREKEISNGIT